MATKKTERHRRKRIAYRSETTREQLEAIEQREARTPERPASLPLHGITVADNVFQWRSPGENARAREDHVRQLQRVLVANRNVPLDPLVVTAIGNKFYLVDGHHRLQAYEELRWSNPIPVKYFEGNVKQAYVEGFHRNARDKLALTNRDKMEAAWKLTKLGGMKQRAISEQTSVSLRRVSDMHKIWKEQGERARGLSWREALRKEDQEYEGFPLEEKAQKLAKQLAKNCGGKLYVEADVTARALEIIDNRLPEALVREWPDQARGVVEDMDKAEDEFQEELKTPSF